MSPLDKNHQLSQLFQLKKQLEQPNQKFWNHFDQQLQRKLLASKILNQPEKLPLQVKIVRALQKYKIHIQAFAYATCGALCIAMMHSRAFHRSSSPFFRSLPDSVSVISLQNRKEDVTLTLNRRKEEHTHYICDRIYLSPSSPPIKELIF
ncbi:MAG: hypothetical protein LBB11_00365 [Puniceicoccales bacterium]|jgi:hypothetical protein|nr:hypothetical protein [Puniceicoccales bacterium]